MNFTTEPSIITLMEGLEEKIRLDLKCAALGRVQKVDTEKGTVDVKLVLRPSMTKVGQKGAHFYDDDNKHTSPVLKEVPILVSYCTRPLYYNDNVLLVFNDHNFDKWYNEDGYIPDLGEWKHDINNAIAIAGIDNLKNSTFIAPEDYKPPKLPSSLMDSPFPKYGYDNENACLHWGNGEVRAGAWGVTLTSRDGADVNVYSENGSVNFYPTVDFQVNTGTCHFIVNSFTTAGAMKGIDNQSLEEKEHKITMYSTALSKVITADDAKEAEELEAQGLEEGDKVFTTDIYRILRLMRAMFKEIATCLGIAAEDGSMGALLVEDKETEAGGVAIKTGADLYGMVNELGNRIDGLFAPADPIKEE